MNMLFSSRLLKQGYRAALVAALLGVALVFGVAHAPAAHAASQSITQGERCQIVLAKLQPGEQTSRVLSSQCAQGNQQLAAPQSGTLLMTWYVDANYGGRSTNIYGDAGPCDSSGYGISYVNNWTTQNWNDVISSFKVWNNCTWTRAYTNANYGGKCQLYDGNTSYVGARMNDQISSFWITSTLHSC